MLEKTFEPQAAEPRLYAQWEESGLFAPRAPSHRRRRRRLFDRHPAAERDRQRCTSAMR
ncbi:MAG: hypothetical protein ACWGHP_10615 [Stenotrophomonas sp.]